MVFASAITFTVIQIWFWWSYCVHTKTKSSPAQEPGEIECVSVVICAHNEGGALMSNLPGILTQVHPKFEVIVVDHDSTDGTAVLLQKLQNTFSNLKILHCHFTTVGKRPPLDLGIRSSLYPYILVTDADCRPTSKNWISLMTAPLTKGYQMVLGAAPLEGPNCLLTAFSKLQSTITYLQYFTAASKGKTFMGVGRNMAYRKDSYLRLYKTEERYIGGDDDLFVNQLEPSSVTVVSEADAHMHSSAPIRWLSLLRQKRRHVSVSWSYSWSQKSMLALFAASHWGHLAAVISLMVLYQSFFLAFSILIMRWLFVYTTLYIRADKFIVGSSVSLLLVSDLFYLIYYPFVALFLIIKPPTKW